MPALRRSSTSRSASVSGTLTSIHMDDLAGDKRRVLQKQHGLDDIVDLAHAPQRMPRGQCSVCRRIMHGSANVAESDGVAPDTVLCVLDGQFSGHGVQPAFGQ